ncbi:MAG: hypothetical protein VKJ86_01480 [Synechococcus sp.]|nr:hypothetical protein [Synechococcus sp.]
MATWEATPTAANLATALSPDTTGTGNVVFAKSPTLTGTSGSLNGTPTAGGASSLTIGGLTVTADGGGAGAVRIIWGVGRAFPSTNTGDV